jgi:hypothetical protein
MVGKTYGLCHYGMQFPANQVRELLELWGMEGYGLSVWVMRVSTAFVWNPCSDSV